MRSQPATETLLSSLLGERPAPPEEGAGDEAVALPPGLERYLSRRLWRQVNEGPPRRGLLLNALERLRSILYLLSTYLPHHLAQDKIRRPVAGQVQGRWLRGTLLFADVSGFTALSERLAGPGVGGADPNEGIEQLTWAINAYFTAMLDVLAQSGGDLLKFAGDALLAYFPEQKDGEQARWAVRAGQRMLAAMDDFAAIPTPMGPVGLQIKIGIGTGGFLAASVGSAERMEYVVLGGVVARTLAAEGVAQVDQIVADEATATYLDAGCCQTQAAGFCHVESDPGTELGSYEIKAERRRARGAIPWNARPHALVAQMEVALRQIEALIPYLAEDLVRQIVGHARQRQVQSENRPATVLFANVTGPETLLAPWEQDQGGAIQADPGRAQAARQVTALLDDYFRAMQRIVAGRGGVVSRIDPYGRGSKMLILFGAPVAHEDDPLRAVTAAGEMNKALARLNARWQRRLAGILPPDEDGPVLRQRMGITQGPTFAGLAGSPTRREYTVMGDDVNLAARLMAAARPGQVLLSQRVYEAVADHAAATALPPIRVKGKSEPIPIYEPAGRRDDPRSVVARRLGQRGALLGREAEIDRLEAVLRRVQAGRGALLTLEGPAGVGKSHLADHLASRAVARGYRAIVAPCRSFGAQTPYAPWIVALQALMGIGPGAEVDGRAASFWQAVDDLHLAGERAEALRGLLDVPARLVPETSLPVRKAADAGQPALFARLEQKVAQADADADRDEFDLWRLVQDRRAAQPQGTWQTLQGRVAARQQGRLHRAVGELLARKVSTSPLLLCFENAQWLDPASEALFGYLAGALRRLPVLILVVRRSEAGQRREALPGAGLTLGPLDRQGTATLAGGLLGKAVDDELAGAIYEQSRGNPLFVEEITRWLRRGGDSARESLRQGLAASNTLQELVLSCLDSLPLGQRDTARAASVAGVEFRLAEVRALRTESLARSRRPVDEGFLRGDLAGLEEAGLVFRAERGADVLYAFRQTALREVAYRSLSSRRRRDLHGRLAAHLEAHYASDLEPHAELLAHHYEAAASSRPAARYLLLAGHKARRRYAYPQARDRYERALAALGQIPEDETDAEARALQARAHEGLGDLASLTGAFAEAVAAYERASALPDAETRPGLGLKLALVLPTQDRAAEAVICARRAWAERAAGDELGAAATLAWLLGREGDEEAEAWIDRGRALVRAESGAWASGIAALLDDLAGDWAAAQRAYLDLGQPLAGALAACRLGDRQLAQGSVAEAAAAYDRAAQLCQAEGDAGGLALAHYRRAEAHLRAGDTTAARAALLEARSLLAGLPLASPEDRQLVEGALQAVDAGTAEPWPVWRWRRYQDSLRISILFQP